VVYIEPGVHFAFTEKQGVEVTIPVSVRGRNWPAGPVFIVSFVSLF
jgi:hypothetical protein